MEKSKKKVADASFAPYSGSGKLTDYGDYKNKSWVMDQIDKGYDKCDRGISVKTDDNGFKRFAKVKKIAFRILTETSFGIQIARAFCILPNDEQNENSMKIAMRWFAYGDLNRSTINELSIIKEFMVEKVHHDINEISRIFELNEEYFGDACVDFDGHGIKIEAIFCMKEKDVEFGNVSDCLKNLGFENADEHFLKEER